MATWHQLQRQTRLFHDTQWTVVEDPPHQTRTLTLCNTETEANAYRDRVKKLRPNVPAYVLRPASAVKRP